MAKDKEHNTNESDSNLPIDEDTLVVSMSSTMKEALGTYASKHRTSMAYIARQAIATWIEYDIENEPKRTRKTRKYANDEERKEAYRIQHKEDRRIVAAIKDKLAKEMKLQGVEALQAWLDAQESSRKENSGK